MLEIARSVYLEEVLFGKQDSQTRLEVNIIDIIQNMHLDYELY